MDTEDKIKEEISKHEQKIKDLKEKALKASGDTKANLEAQIKVLKSRVDAANAKWEKLQSQGKGILDKGKGILDNERYIYKRAFKWA